MGIASQEANATKKKTFARRRGICIHMKSDILTNHVCVESHLHNLRVCESFVRFPHTIEIDIEINFEFNWKLCPIYAHDHVLSIRIHLHAIFDWPSMSGARCDDDC